MRLFWNSYLKAVLSWNCLFNRGLTPSLSQVNMFYTLELVVWHKLSATVLEGPAVGQRLLFCWDLRITEVHRLQPALCFLENVFFTS